MAPFRFGVQLSRAESGAAWRATARRIEDLGYTTLFVPDHFEDQYGPLVALTVAAEATTSLRVGSLVFGNDYRHPVVLAKEIATLDVLSGGRVEFGLGAGWMTSDYEQSGIAHDPPGVRITRMAESLAVLKALWSDGQASFEGEHYRVTGAIGAPVPVQRPHPPVIIGGGGERVLSLAAREADIVGVNPSLAAGYVGPEVLETTTAEYYHRRLEWIRKAAGTALRRSRAPVPHLPRPDRARPGRRPVEAGGDPVGDARGDRRLPDRPDRDDRRDRRSTATAPRRVRALLHRRPRGRDGGVRPGGGRAHRHLSRRGRAPRIGIFGGTFDPVHSAHLEAADSVRRSLDLDRMLLVVANQPWQKEGERPLTPAEDRYAMVAAAVAGRPGLEASRLEIDRGGPSYSIDTVRTLHRADPDAELFLVVGSDVVPALATWHEEPALRNEVTLVVVGRPGGPLRRPGPGWRTVEVPLATPSDLSSTELRRRLEAGEPVGSLVPDAVIRCIEERGLYAEGR